MFAAVPALSDAASLRGKVTKVTDGDTVTLKVGAKTRTLDLAGLDAPERSACFGPQAKARLSKLLPKGAKVKASTSGGKAVLVTGRTNVNRALVKGGFARANASGGGALGEQLRSDQAAAQVAGAGLWKACAEPSPQPTPTNTETTPTPTPTPPADVTGQAAIDRMTAELEGNRWRMYTSGSQSSTVYVLNLCRDGTFYRTGESVGVFVWKYGTWKVTDAYIAGDGSARSAIVIGTPSEGDPAPDGTNYEFDLVAKPVGDGTDQWYWNQVTAQFFAGAADCTH